MTNYHPSKMFSKQLAWYQLFPKRDRKNENNWQWFLWHVMTPPPLL